MRHARMRKLCSRDLSDSLSIICSDKGFNEPRTPLLHSGPGIVEECCLSRCTYEQLRQYCRE